MNSTTPQAENALRSKPSLLPPSSEIRLIAAIRWLPATAALTIIYIDPREPDNQTWAATYFILAAYVLYSSILYFLAIRANGAHIQRFHSVRFEDGSKSREGCPSMRSIFPF